MKCGRKGAKSFEQHYPYQCHRHIVDDLPAAESVAVAANAENRSDQNVAADVVVADCQKQTAAAQTAAETAAVVGRVGIVAVACAVAAGAAETAKSTC